jgi:hypothetical protein
MAKKKKDKQRSIKHTHRTNDRVTRTPLKTGDENEMDITYDDEKHLRDHYAKNIQETTTQYLNLNISDWSIPHWNVKYK